MCLPPFYFPQIIISEPCTASYLSHQDLSNEQARSQELSVEVQRLSQELQKAETELKATTDSLDQSRERIESLSLCLKKSESLLQLETRRGSAEVDAPSNSDSSNKTHICQTNTRETSHLDQSPDAGKGRDLSVTPGESERQLSERLIELEKEVRICVWIHFWDWCVRMCEPLNLIYRISAWFSAISVWWRWSRLCWNSCSGDASRLSTHSRPPYPWVQHFISRTTALSLLISFYNVTSATVNLPYLLCCSRAGALTLSLKHTHRNSHIHPNIELEAAAPAKVRNFIFLIGWKNNFWFSLVPGPTHTELQVHLLIRRTVVEEEKVPVQQCKNTLLQVKTFFLKYWIIQLSLGLKQLFK